MSKITHLYRYPLKSCKGELMPQAQLDLYGMEGDRTFALLGANGHLLSARSYPKLLLISAADYGDCLEITLQDGKKHRFNYHLKEQKVAQHFSATFDVLTISFEADSWFSAYLNTPCRLVINDDSKPRSIKAKYSSDGRPLKMTDASPLLLVNQASVDELNSRLKQPFDHRNFRPNLVVDFNEPFIEHQMKRLQIGSMEFVKMSDCKRCQVTTLNADTAQAYGNGEPLRTLAKYRTAEDGMVIFGVYLLPISKGIIQQGDPVSYS